MSNAAIAPFGRTILIPFTLLLAGCNSATTEQVDEQVAMAQEAAGRALEAQAAAERAAKLARAQSSTGTFGDDEIIVEDMEEPFHDDTSDDLGEYSSDGGGEEMPE